MKKLNISAANAIVGGNCKEKSCSVKFNRVTGGACMQVTTCLNKHGAAISETSVRAPSSQDCDKDA